MTVNSEVGICNLALDLLNVAPIESIETPESPTEELCSRWYDQTRRNALRRHPWNFAAKRVILAPDATDPAFGYSAQFTLPADYIRLMHLNESVLQNETPVPQALYTVEDKKILIGGIRGDDPTQLNLVYVSDFQTVSLMDPSFIDYFSTMLAQKLAYKVTQSSAQVERLNALMGIQEDIARAMDGQENPPKRVERSRARRSRRNVGSVRNYDGTVVFD